MPDRSARRGLARLGTTLIVLGILGPVALGGYALYGNWRLRQDQAGAAAAWRPAATVIPAAPSGQSGSPPPAASVGDPAWPWKLEIPTIGLQWLVYDGASVGHLRRHGAGHIEWTRLPWEDGTVAIAGHRTTYGAPFYRLDRLAPGDAIRLRTAAGTFVYRVTERIRVRPSAGQVLASQQGTRRLALIACDPPFSARFRLVVFARLVEVAADAGSE